MTREWRIYSAEEKKNIIRYWKKSEKSYCAELEEFLEDNKENQGFIVYAADEEGIRTKRLLESCGKKVALFCDDSEKLIGNKVEGLEVISPEQMVLNYSKHVVILARRATLADTYSMLLRNGFPRKQILFPMHMHLVASNSLQYFDTLPPVKDEIFVDAGSYDGDTIREFIKWSKGQYQKIYAFEPNSDMAQTVEAYIQAERIQKITFVHKATWEKEENIKFVNDAAASRIGEEEGLWCKQ